MSNYAYAGGSQPPVHLTERAKPINKPVFITGGSGKLGRAVVKEMNDHGYFTITLDINPAPAGTPADSLPKAFIKTNLTSMGDVFEALTSIDDRYTLSAFDQVAVIHLGAIPAPGLGTQSVIMQNNMMSTYNIFEACRKLGIKNIVSASSETLIGLPLDPVLPDSLPITESSQPPRPESAYSLSKLLGEVTAEQYCRWDSTLKIVSMRFSNVMAIKDYEKFKTEAFQKNEKGRRWNAFGYIDARDGAQACRKAIEKAYSGHHIYIIANDDTVFHRPTAELVKEHFSGVQWNASEMEYGRYKGNEGLLGNGLARKELGFEPKYTWRD